ncbi:hypothetical protein [Aliidiomarina indica]|uniref:hypothetical protein n=1 Tax=Aliidiomarina indica TaxID=2749147 RepID=UPI00188F0D8E|nr:hypothetical protein [Aliidiomarina indica]
MNKKIFAVLRVALISLALVLTLTPSWALAETWSEPWHREVLEKSDTLALVQLVETHREYVELQVLRVLAGDALPSIVRVQSPVQVELTSASGHRHALIPWIRKDQSAYVLLSRANEKWRLLSPSAGIATLHEANQVAATYRISFHQVLQPAEDYERLQPCLFRVFRNEDCDFDALADLIILPLHEAAAGLSPDANDAEIQLFFRQHVALESSYLLRRPLPLATIEPFLTHDFFHTQISGVRALAVVEGKESAARLTDFVRDPTRSGVARNMAVLMLAERHDSSALQSLREQIEEIEGLDEESTLPLSSFMDPRIGTHFPRSVRQALEYACTDLFPCTAQGK